MHNVHLVLNPKSSTKRVRELLKASDDDFTNLWSKTLGNVCFTRVHPGDLLYAKLPVTFGNLPEAYRAFNWLRYEMNFYTAHGIVPGRYTDDKAQAIVTFNAERIDPYEVHIVGDDWVAVRRLYEIIMSRSAAPDIVFAAVIPTAEEDEEFDSGTLD